jgi:hypothetical protein
MVLYVYTYKTSWSYGRPNWAWVRRSKWVFLKYEESPRFKHILDVLDRWGIPKLPIGRENKIKGYIVLKLDEVREFLSIVASDLLYDVFLSDERLRGLEEHGWEVEVVNASPLLYVLWQIGLGSKAKDRVSEVKEKFRAMVNEAKKEKEKEGK